MNDQGTAHHDGVDLHYHVTGEGRPLLLVQGGAGDADENVGLRDALSSRFRVITYDRRGLSRSTMPPSPGPTTSLSEHAADAQRVLEATTADPAIIVGTSIGALIGLTLATECSATTGIVVAHEPPLLSVLPEEERNTAATHHERVSAAYRRGGLRGALPELYDLVGLRPTASTPMPPRSPQWIANFDHYLDHDFDAVRTHVVDLSAIARRMDDGVSVIVGAGEDSGMGGLGISDGGPS